MVELRKMSASEFIGFNEKCIAELTDYYLLKMAPAEARIKAEEEQVELLPAGVDTENQFLFSSFFKEKKIGSIWFGKINREDSDIAFIFYIGIDEKYRNKGFGSAAMAAIEDIIKGQRLNRIRLHVLKKNVSAKKMYKKLGYIHFKDYEGYDEKDPGVLLEKIVKNNHLL